MNRIAGFVDSVDVVTWFRMGLIMFFGLVGLPAMRDIYGHHGWGAAVLVFACYMLLAWTAIRP